MRIKGQCVLIVEDDFFIAADLAEVFTETGATVIGPAGSVAEAMDLIACAGRLDAAVLDVNLRREKVYPVSDLLARRRVPCLLLTGDGRAQDDPRLSGFPVLAKPVGAAGVADAVRLLLQDRGACAP